MEKEKFLTRVTLEFGGLISVSAPENLPGDIPMNKTKVVFVCPLHGEFSKTPTNLLRGRGKGCPTCNRVEGRQAKQQKLLAVFKVEAPKKFNNKFTYDYSTFKGHRKPMRMLCPEHGEFWAEPTRHLHTFAAGGCQQCDKLLKRGSKVTADEAWFAKGKEIHQSKYKYLSITPVVDVTYSRERAITYLCPIHGKQIQNIENHIYKKHGCIKCAHAKVAENYLRNPEDVQREVESLFPGKLSFEKFIYTGGVDLFTLICLEHNKEFQTNMSNIRSHPAFYSCPICSPRCDSGAQREVYKGITELGIEALYNDRKTLDGKEIDIFIPSLKLGIEYNGVFWHSEKWMSKTRDAKWHMLEKQQLAATKGIELVHFNSVVPTEKIVSFIKFKAGKVSRVFARKTSVSLVGKEVAEKMLDELHIQGAVKGCASYGLHLGGELLGVASFSKATSERGNKDLNRWELRRMVFTCHVVGGASKLLKAFTREHPEVTSIISYSDNRWFTGGVYKALGFEHVKDCPIDYAYTKSDAVWHKAQFKHSVMKTKKNFNYDPDLTEVQNCHANGYFRIWDCGKKKWELKLTGDENGES